MLDTTFDPVMLNTLIGGSSVLDVPRLRLKTKDEAEQFLLAYGYSVDDESDVARLWSFHRRAVTYLQTQLLPPGEVVPEQLSEAVLIGDITQLLLWASSDRPEDRERQSWACAIVRIMHVINHLSNDLFTAFSEDIQAQVLKPYHDMVVTGADGGVTLTTAGDPEAIPLEKFDIKPFKTSNSSITKLLAKPEEVAFSVLDKMGVRFVTRTVFDSFRVLRWLERNHVISYPHLIPDQSNNTLYPLNLFHEVLNELPQGRELTGEEIDHLLRARLDNSKERATYREKLNKFTDRNYRFMKFIVRRLIRAKTEAVGRPFMFFYPYEVQVMDLATFESNLQGPSSHAEYKARQRNRARERVFGLGTHS